MVLNFLDYLGDFFIQGLKSTLNKNLSFLILLFVLLAFHFICEITRINHFNLRSVEGHFMVIKGHFRVISGSFQVNVRTGEKCYQPQKP